MFTTEKCLVFNMVKMILTANAKLNVLGCNKMLLLAIINNMLIEFQANTKYIMECLRFLNIVYKLFIESSISFN